jgi:hypothetical protein
LIRFKLSQIGFAEPSVVIPVMTLTPVAQLDIADRKTSFVTSASVAITLE